MPSRTISQNEFVVLIAMLTASVAFSVDAMLPALPQIAAELVPEMPNEAQLIITSFVLGMGIGTFFTGPLSDCYGRKATIVGGAALYIVGALLAWAAPSLETMLAARVLMGLGAAGPRVVALAVVRDLYSGRIMARIVSFVMIVFTLIPAFAPSLGAGIMALTGWRGIFLAFTVFSVVTTGWLMFRLPETLPKENRRPVRAPVIWAATKEVLTHPTVRLSIVVQSLAFAMLFTMISSTQQIFDEVFGRGTTFHFWFGGIALCAGSAGFINSQLVVKLGMRKIIKVMFGIEMMISAAMLLIAMSGVPQEVLFPAYVIWVTSVFFQTGMCVGNLNALAMEPMGHIAGIAASIIAAISTIAAAIIAIPIGLSYNGTIVPIAFGIFLCAALARLVSGFIRRDQSEDAEA
ncbi:MFS transporter, DHA1 family, bicyclomycin/chloramphenicol resistance protein [Poseidonocella pacifica]|uniref:MFS transporter, DHA1 family, bicyclomycin/chloramphenicol resistance protein n=1 Tax=Poseidonocella pacifica TaxID=871651 RepID=A0A1I0VKY4_9RHOB|nr:multidrug effflux MFS transporter [Poseidonocella pacifica]SFA77129.1 MFS transporter, DHA1 family, bicyclomycin/chloramphenicol resistance protein [Poseidonocella pacifica]